MKRLDVSQVLTDYDGTPMRDGDAPLTLQNCLLALLRGMPEGGLSTNQQADIFKLGCRIASAKKNIEMEQSHYESLKKFVDAERPKAHPNGMPNPLATVLIAPQIRELVNAAESFEDFSATAPTNRIAKKSKSDANGELAGK